MSAAAPHKITKHFFWRWIKRRAPRAAKVTLQHCAIYVLPNRAGLGFAATIILLWLLGTNYQNNLVLAVSFLLMALFVVSILHAFNNLVGLQLHTLGRASGFVGELVDVSLVLSSPSGRVRQAIELNLAQGTHARVDTLDTQPQITTLGVNAHRRGWLTLERLRVQSYYPLGMLRVWSWVYLDAPILVYPQPLPAELIALGDGSPEGSQSHQLSQHDDFIGFKSYQPGAAATHIAWKLYARGAGLQLKQFAGAGSRIRWLDYRALAGTSETRLSGLCYLALQCHRAGYVFGLRLPDKIIEPAIGEEHLHQVLSALALFGDKEPSL